MASVRKSHTRTQLDYAIGNKRADLGKLSPEEFDVFLADILNKVNPRPLRGFTELRYLFPRGRDEGFFLPEDVKIENRDCFGDGTEITLKTQMARGNRGLLEQALTYRQHETGRETTNEKEVREWEGSAYVLKGRSKFLAIRRPPNHTSAKENLAVVEYWFDKVQFKDRYKIHTIQLQRIPIDRFREYFSDEYPGVAVELINEIASLHTRTVKDLQHSLERVHREEKEFERIASSITY